MKTILRGSALAGAAATFLLMGSLAQASSLPPVHHNGAVEYLSGGIGQDESTAIEHASKKWPLTLEFAVKDKKHAEFTADVKVVVRDAKQHQTLQTESNGPFLLAKLKPGKYEVDATLDGKTLHEKVDVRHDHPAKLMFVWPSGTAAKSS